MYKCRVTYDEWKCIQEKNRVGKILHETNYSGYIGLLKIEQVSERQVWNYNGTDITVCDNGYRWLTIMPENEFYCITVMMDDNYDIQVSYIDIIDSQGIDEDGVPYFYDIYLDLVVYPDGHIVVDDMDELEEAYATNDISEIQYLRTLDIAKQLQEGLLMDKDKFNTYIVEKLKYVRES